MASPQKENGYIEIANEIAEKLAMLHMSGNEWMIWWVVIRKTWGWKKKEDRISLSQFQNLTNLSRPAVALAVDRLVAKNVLVAKPLPLGKEFSFNKDHETWTGSEKATSSIINTRVVAKPLLSIVAKPLHTKETTTKTTITKENYGKPVFEKGNGMESIKGIINKFHVPVKAGSSKNVGISREWQEKAFRYAKGLNLTLTGSTKGRWLKMFKQASEGRKTANLDEAYTFLFDYPKQITNDQKILFFFKIYENGKSWMNEGR